ncbi:hypothetical protein [Puerhibacterium sp. TATVAM-FAB25]|uniref:hypothetical protein n=1 Tax=Puerhibacterium sp. TATVAM-FAB25 TaxID=3093699 RepID=UPI003978CA6D
MRPAVLYPVGTVAVVALTVLLFTVDLPGAPSAVAQVAWVVLVAALCWAGARDIGRRLEAEGRLPARRRGLLRPAPRVEEGGDAAGGAPGVAGDGAARPGGPTRADDPVLQMLDALTPDEERRRRPE